MTRSVNIVGLGTAVPAYRMEQGLAATLAAQRCCATPRQDQWLRTIYEKSGVARRSTVLLAGSNGGAASRSSTPWNGSMPESTACLAATAPQGIAALMAETMPLPVDPADRGPSTARRMGWYAQLAPALAQSACREALDEAGLPASEITHLITVSCTGFFAPGLDVDLIGRLGLSPDIGRTNVGFMGCHGGFNALQLARALALAAPRAAVLVCCVELCSLHFHYGWDPQRVVTDALFADGASAAIVRADAPGGQSIDALAAPRQWTLRDAGSYVVPNSLDAMTWHIGDHGFEMTLGPQVPQLIEHHVGPWLARFLSPHHLTPADIARWAIHPGGPKVLAAVGRALDLSEDALVASRGVLAGHGNMSSATILFILKRLREMAVDSSGDGGEGGGKCVALGFGPGLVVEGLLLNLSGPT